MSHSYLCNHIHVVFSTKGRRNFITPHLQQRLWPYIRGIARENGMKALAIGGTENHLHGLVSMPATVPVAKAMQLIKGGSSKWIRDIFPTQESFEWQQGYGAFSVSASQIGRTIQYIRNQPQHHQSQTFQEEFVAFLNAHGIDYDPRHVFG